MLIRRKLTVNSNGNLYHYSNEGVASWYDFAISIMKIGAQRTVKLNRYRPKTILPWQKGLNIQC